MLWRKSRGGLRVMRTGYTTQDGSQWSLHWKNNIQVRSWRLGSKVHQNLQKASRKKQYLQRPQAEIGWGSCGCSKVSRKWNRVEGCCQEKMGVWVGLVNKSATGRWQWLRGPVVKTVPPTQGTKVQSLVRKLRFHTLLGTAYTHIYTYTYIYMLMCVCVCVYIYIIYI